MLADHASAAGNLELIAQLALEKISPGDTQRCIEEGKYRVYLSVSKKLTYMCITDEAYPSGRAFRLLENIEKKLFTEKLYPRAVKARPYELRNDFSEKLAVEMAEIDGSGVHKLMSKADQVQQVIKQDLNKVVERGEALDTLLGRSEILAQDSSVFNRQATKLRRKILWKSVKLWVVVGVIVTTVLAVIIVIIVLAATKKI